MRDTVTRSSAPLGGGASDGVAFAATDGFAARRSAVASARDDLVQAKEPHAIWLARSEVYAYDAATFESDESTRALDRLTRMAVSSDSKEWGRSTNRRCAVIEQVPECRDMTPKHLALSLLFFNGDGVFMPSPTHLASLEAVVAEAELCKHFSLDADELLVKCVRLLRRGHDEHLHLAKLMQTIHAPSLRTGGAGFSAETMTEGRHFDRELRFFHNFIHVYSTQ